MPCILPYEMFGTKKKQSNNTCYNLDESWKYANWKKVVTKDHKLYLSVYMKYPKNENSVDKGHKLVFA